MTQQKIYESNLSSLKKHHPDIFETISNNQITAAGKLLNSRDGAKNLKIIGSDGKEYLMHGESGPSEDTAQFLNIVPETASGVIAMLGFGLGIPCLEILKNRPNLRHLFIFELNPDIFKQALFANDLSDLFSDQRVVFCLKKKPSLNSVFASAFKTLELEDIQILKHGPSFRFDPNYPTLSDKLYSYLNAFSISGTTTKVMGKKFIRNRFENLKRIRNDSLIDSFRGIFNDIPAVLVAGGPSLNKNIDQLEKTKGKAVLFAVDSVVPALLKKGIIPDFITTIDPQKITLEKFRGAKLPPEGISLICSAWVTPKVPFHWPSERVIWTYGGKNIELWLNKILGGTNSYIGAGTVAHLNLHTALDMGCKPIIFVGQDLAYSETKDHADNISLNNNTEMKKILDRKDDWRWVKGIQGGQVKTSRSFLNNKDVFEGIIKQHNIDFINATEGGAHIEGAKALSLKEVLEKTPFSGTDVKKIISQHALKLDDKIVDELDKHLEDLILTGNEIFKKIKVANTVSLELIKNLTTLKNKSKRIENFSNLPPKIQKKLLKMDKLSAALDKPGIYWYILDEVTYDGLKQSEKMLHEIEITAQDKSKYLDWVLKNVKRFVYINEVRSELISWLEKDISAVLDFHKKEKHFIDSIKFNKTPSKSIKDACQFYFENNITSLATKLLKQLDNVSNDADLQYILGCSSAICGDQKLAEQYFEIAISLDQSIKTQINTFKMQEADEYCKFGEKWQSIDIKTSKRLLLNGLHYNNDHEEIKKKLLQLLKKEMETVSSHIENNQYNDAQKMVSSWINDIEENSLVKNIIGKDQVASLYSSAGKIHVHEGNFKIAYDDYIKAAETDPNNPQHYIQLTDLCFSVEDYDKGVTALNIAVQLDQSNAKYWEIIGDTMAKAGNMNDALSAYEKCFLELPGRIHLLKKIGDIYLAMGETDAAHEAYKQYKNKIDPPKA